MRYNWGLQTSFQYITSSLRTIHNFSFGNLKMLQKYHQIQKCLYVFFGRFVQYNGMIFSRYS